MPSPVLVAGNDAAVVQAVEQEQGELNVVVDQNVAPVLKGAGYDNAKAVQEGLRRSRARAVGTGTKL
ncbi:MULTISPECIES: hypothetical protein [Cryobacterium]|uniref:hypothetical protein n=1 Tax=Cryobacterium TaxID=69578 RepID=UPI0030BA2344